MKSLHSSHHPFGTTFHETTTDKWGHHGLSGSGDADLAAVVGAVRREYEKRLEGAMREVHGVLRGLPMDPLLAEMVKDAASARHIQQHVAEMVREVLRAEQEGTIANLTVERSMLKSELATLRRHVEIDVVAEREDALRRIDELTNEVSRVRSSEEVAEQRLVEAQKQLAEAKEEVARLVGQLSTADDRGEVCVLREKLSDLQRSFTSLTAAADRVMCKIDGALCESIPSTKSKQEWGKLGTVCGLCIDLLETVVSLRGEGYHAQHPSSVTSIRHRITLLLEHQKELHKRLKWTLKDRDSVVQSLQSKSGQLESTLRSFQSAKLQIQKREGGGERGVAGASDPKVEELQQKLNEITRQLTEKERAKEEAERVAQLHNTVTSQLESFKQSMLHEHRPMDNGAYIPRSEHLLALRSAEAQLIGEAREFLSQREHEWDEERKGYQKTLQAAKAEAVSREAKEKEVHEALRGEKERCALLEKQKTDAVSVAFDCLASCNQSLTEGVASLVVDLHPLRGTVPIEDDPHLLCDTATTLEEQSRLLRQRIRSHLRLTSGLAVHLRQLCGQQQHMSLHAAALRSQRLLSTRHRLLEMVTSVRRCSTGVADGMRAAVHAHKMLLRDAQDGVNNLLSRLVHSFHEKIEAVQAQAAEEVKRISAEVKDKENHVKLAHAAKERAVHRLATVLDVVSLYSSIPDRLKDGICSGDDDVTFTRHLHALDDVLQRNIVPTGKMDELQQAHAALQEELKGRQGDADTGARCVALQGEVAKLEHTVRRHEETISTLTSKLEGERNTATALQQQLQGAKEALHEAKERIVSEVKERKELSSKLTAEQAGCAEMKHKMAEATADRRIVEASLQGLKEERDTLTSKVRVLEERVGELEEAAQGYEAEIADYQQSVKTLQGKVTDLQLALKKEQLKAGEIEDRVRLELRHEVEALRHEASRAQRALERMKKEKEATQAKLSQAHSDHETAIAEMQAVHKAALLQLRKESQRVEELSTKCSAKDRELAALTATHDKR